MSEIAQSAQALQFLGDAEIQNGAAIDQMLAEEHRQQQERISQEMYGVTPVEGSARVQAEARYISYVRSQAENGQLAA